MRNLLPQTFKKGIRREYRSRLVVVSAFSTAAVSVIGIAALVPAYVTSTFQVEEIKRQAQSLEQVVALQQSDPSFQAVAQARAQMRLFNTHATRTPLNDTMARVINALPSEVTITSFSYSPRDVHDTLELTGDAETRDALLSFKEALEQDAELNNVSFPVGNLAHSKDITFSLTLEIEN